MKRVLFVCIGNSSRSQMAEAFARTTMGCEDACPAVAARRHLAWELPPPTSVPPEEFGSVCDAIEGKVKELLASL